MRRPQDARGPGLPDWGTMTGHLFLVPTPIGNLGDLTDRAREALAGADLVVTAMVGGRKAAGAIDEYLKSK